MRSILKHSQQLLFPLVISNILLHLFIIRIIMNSKEQLAILKARHQILKIVDTEVGKLETRLNNAAPEINALAQLVLAWIDETAKKYKAAGCEQHEWAEDIRAWLVQHQFFVEDIDDSSIDTLYRVHLSMVGWGRHVILTFTMK